MSFLKSLAFGSCAHPGQGRWCYANHLEDSFMVLKKNVVVSVLYCVKLRAQTEVPGEMQVVEQEEREVFYLVMRMLRNGLPGIPWHLRLKVKFFYFDASSSK